MQLKLAWHSPRACFMQSDLIRADPPGSKTTSGAHRLVAAWLMPTQEGESASGASSEIASTVSRVRRLARLAGTDSRHGTCAVTFASRRAQDSRRCCCPTCVLIALCLQEADITANRHSRLSTYTGQPLIVNGFDIRSPSASSEAQAAYRLRHTCAPSRSTADSPPIRVVVGQ